MSERSVIKVTQVRRGDGAMLVKLDGRLDECTAGALNGLVLEGEVVLDLSGLAAVDAVGIARLVELVRAGCRAVGGSLYVRRLLEEAGI